MLDFENDPTTTRKRQVNLPNGNKYHIESKDPYGMWEIHMDKGQIPDKLKGSYTSFDRALQALQGYLGEQVQETVPEPVEMPEKTEKTEKTKEKNVKR